MKTYLERIDPAAGMARFYTVRVTATLFGEWAVVREWGRIGQAGTVRDAVFGSETEAEQAAVAVVYAKLRGGYVAGGAIGPDGHDGSTCRSRAGQ